MTTHILRAALMSAVLFLAASAAALEEVGPASSIYCPNLTSSFQMGARDTTTGGQVSMLQTFLSEYYDIDPDNIVTGFFGNVTRTTVRKFQCEVGIACSGNEATTGWGRVGPATRAAIAARCGGYTPPTPQPQTSCYWNGSWIAHGTTVTGFQSPTANPGGQCVSQARTCNNGNLTGTFQYATCATYPTGQACYFNGQTVPHGNSITAWQSSSVGAGQSCVSEARTCNNGALSGSYQHTSCSNLSCPSVQQPTGNSCTTTTGQPGSWQYYANYNGCPAWVCVANSTTGQSCTTPWGTTIAHNATTTAYQSATVGSGSSCVSEVRACNNGSLSGSYQNASCVVGSGISCSSIALQPTSGATVNGNSFTTYRDRYIFANRSIPTTGKWYFEVAASQNGRETVPGIGQSTSTMRVASYYYLSTRGAGEDWGNNADGSNAGLRYVSLPALPSLAGYAAVTEGPATGNGTYMVAIDMDADKLYVGYNGTWGNGGNPGTGTGSINNVSGNSYSLKNNTWYPGVGNNSALYTPNTSAGTVNFGASSFAHKPSGYTALCTQ